MNNNFCWLVSLFITFGVGCIDNMPKQENLIAKKTQTLSPNGAWSLSYPMGFVAGDTINISETSSLDPYGNSDQYLHIDLSSSQYQSIIAKVILQPINPLAPSDYQVVHLQVYDFDGNLLVDQSNQSVASLNWQDQSSVSGSVNGNTLDVVWWSGDSSTFSSFQLDFAANLEGQDEIQQEPIPNSDDSIECPLWSFSDTIGTNYNYSLRQDNAYFDGRIAQSQIAPNELNTTLIKLKSGIIGESPMKGAELYVQGVPLEGFVGQWPGVVKIVTVRQDNDRSWTAPTYTGQLEIYGWENGLMFARVDVENSHHVDLSYGYVPYYESQVSMHLYFNAPHPTYNSAYQTECVNEGQATTLNKEYKNCMEKAKKDHKSCLKKAGKDDRKKAKCDRDYRNDQSNCKKYL